LLQVAALDRTGELGPGLRHFGEDRTLLLRIRLDRFDQVGDEIGAALQLDLDLRGGGGHLLVIGLNRVVAATGREHQADEGDEAGTGRPARRSTARSIVKKPPALPTTTRASCFGSSCSAAYAWRRRTSLPMSSCSSWRRSWPRSTWIPGHGSRPASNRCASRMSSYSIGNASADSRHSRSLRMRGAGWPARVQARIAGAS